MVTTSERAKLRAELSSQGYAWEYIDEWQPKITLYRHAPAVNVSSGEVIFPVGEDVKNLPGNPDYVLRKSRQGLLPYPPNDGCACRWCAEKNLAKQIAEEVSEEYRCDEEDCNFFAVSETHAGKLSSLRMHKRSAHK